MSLPIHFSSRDAAKVFLFILVFGLLLIALVAINAALGNPSLNLGEFINLDGEGNLPAWFSSSQLFLIGMVFLIRSRQKTTSAPPPGLFIAAGAGFIFLSADEAARIHEFLVFNVFRLFFKQDHLFYSWSLFYGVIAVILLATCLRPLIALWNHHRRETLLMIIGMAMIVFGAVVLESISFLYLRDGSSEFAYSVEVALEEFFEMSGASVILYGALLTLCPKASDERVLTR